MCVSICIAKLFEWPFDCDKQQQQQLQQQQQVMILCNTQVVLCRICAILNLVTENDAKNLRP